MFWLVKIWQVSSCGKFMQRLKTCLLIAGADSVLSWSFVSSCDVLNCLFLLGLQNEIQLISRLFCNSWLVCLLCFLLTNAPLVKVIGWKSDFGWHRFQNWAYSLALAWGVRDLKSLKRFWNIWWLSEAASRMVSLSNYCLCCVFFSVSWSRAYGLSLYTSNDLTNRSFLTANSKKRFRRLFSYYCGCKQKALTDFLASSSSWKRANTGGRLKT